MKKLICLLITFLLVISSVGFAFADEASPMRIGRIINSVFRFICSKDVYLRPRVPEDDS